MTDKQQIQTWIEEKLAGTGYELITLTVSAQNDILVEVDRLEGVDVDFCAELNRNIVEQLDAAGEDDYSLEVGSVSLTRSNPRCSTPRTSGTTWRYWQRTARNTAVSWCLWTTIHSALTPK